MEKTKNNNGKIWVFVLSFAVLLLSGGVFNGLTAGEYGACTSGATGHCAPTMGPEGSKRCFTGWTTMNCGGTIWFPIEDEQEAQDDEVAP